MVETLFKNDFLNIVNPGFALVNNLASPVRYQLGSWPAYSQISANGKIDFTVGTNPEQIRFEESGLQIYFKKEGAVISSFTSVAGQWKPVGDNDTIQVGEAASEPAPPVVAPPVEPTIETVTTTEVEPEPVVQTTSAPVVEPTVLKPYPVPFVAAPAPVSSGSAASEDSGSKIKTKTWFWLGTACVLAIAYAIK